MTVKIIPLADDVPYPNILVYGDSGVGKTVFAGSDRKVLFLAPEDSGTLSALRLGSKAEKIKIHDWDNLKEAYEWLYDNPEILKKYDWLVVDSLTEMQAMCMRGILALSADDKRKREQDPDQPQLQEYGKLYVLFEKMVRAINDLPVKVLYTALARKVEDADHNEFLVPEIQGKDYGIAMKIVALVNCYGYMKCEVIEVPDPTEDNPNRVKRVKQRIIFWEDTGTIRGKDRTNRLTPKTTNFTLQKVRRCMDGDIDNKGNVLTNNKTTTVTSKFKSIAIQTTIEGDKGKETQTTIEDNKGKETETETETVEENKELTIVEP